jgi:hypothetical protein
MFRNRMYVAMGLAPDPPTAGSNHPMQILDLHLGKAPLSGAVERRPLATREEMKRRQGGTGIKVW